MIRIRDLDPESDAELDVVTRMCRRTVLETIPELEGSEDKAQAVSGNFSYAQMNDMIRACSRNPAHRLLVAVEESGRIVGHSMISQKVDSEGRRYGYFFSRFVEPSHRRRGIATRLLAEALAWFEASDVEYLRAETHATNHALQALMLGAGFRVAERHDAPWPYLVLRKGRRRASRPRTTGAR